MKPIKEYGIARLVWVESIREAEIPDWKWRKLNIGRTGNLVLYASEHKYPGKQFIHIENDDGWWLSTGYGTAKISENHLIFTTENSIYTFETRCLNSK